MCTVMAAFRGTPERSGVPAPGPVFVDNSGRRLRRARAAGVVTLALVAGYGVLFLLAFFGGPNIAAPYLPQPVPGGPRAEKTVPAPSTSTPPAANPGQDVGSVPDARAVPVGLAATGAPAAAAAPAAPSAPAPPGSKAQVSQPARAARANAAWTPAPAAQGSAPQVPAPSSTDSSTEPGKSETAPGQASRPAPTPPPHP
jgi:hypothetical protein